MRLNGIPSVLAVSLVALAGCTGGDKAPSTATVDEPATPEPLAGPAANFTAVLARAQEQAPRNATFETQPFERQGSVRPMVEASGQRLGPCVGPYEAPINVTRCHTVLFLDVDEKTHWANLTVEWSGPSNLGVRFGPAICCETNSIPKFVGSPVEAEGASPLALQWLGPAENGARFGIQVGFANATTPVALHQEAAFRAFGEFVLER